MPFSTPCYQATALAFSPQGTRLAVGIYAGGYYFASNGLGRVLRWQATNGWTGSNVTLMRTRTNHCGQSTTVVFLGGTTLAAGNAAGSHIVAPVPRRGHCGAIRGALDLRYKPGRDSFPGSSPDGSMLASDSDSEERTVRWWDVASGSLPRTLSGPANGVTCLAFSPRGDLLVSAAAAPAR